MEECLRLASARQINLAQRAGAQGKFDCTWKESVPGGSGVASRNRTDICPPFVRALPPSIWKSHICVLTVNHNISHIYYWIIFNNF